MQPRTPRGTASTRDAHPLWQPACGPGLRTKGVAAVCMAVPRSARVHGGGGGSRSGARLLTSLSENECKRSGTSVYASALRALT